MNGCRFWESSCCRLVSGSRPQAVELLAASGGLPFAGVKLLGHLPPQNQSYKRKKHGRRDHAGRTSHVTRQVKVVKTHEDQEQEDSGDRERRECRLAWLLGPASGVKLPMPGFSQLFLGAKLPIVIFGSQAPG